MSFPSSLLYLVFALFEMFAIFKTTSISVVQSGIIRFERSRSTACSGSLGKVLIGAWPFYISS